MGGYGHNLKYRAAHEPLLIIDTEIEGDNRFLTVELTWDALWKLRGLLNGVLPEKQEPPLEDD